MSEILLLWPVKCVNAFSGHIHTGKPPLFLELISVNIVAVSGKEAGLGEGANPEEHVIFRKTETNVGYVFMCL